MFTAKHFRTKAAEFAEALKHADVPSEIREFQRSEASFNALAENDDWLANNFDRSSTRRTPLQRKAPLENLSRMRLSPKSRSVFFAA